MMKIKNKRGQMMQEHSTELIWLLIFLAIVIGGYLILKGKGTGIIDRIINFLRFKG